MMKTKLLLSKFHLVEKFRNLEPFSIKFQNQLTVIVGENGSGKSSFFSLLTNSIYQKLIKIEHAPGISYHFFDTEKHNPRIKNGIEYSVNAEFDLVCRFCSHGEALMPILKGMKSFQSKLILVDEPESGISLTNQRELLKTFNAAISNNCQIIISTHSYYLIKNVQNIFNMNSKKWETSKKFLSRFDKMEIEQL